jgi:broad specificity phosphatase PhoE
MPATTTRVLLVRHGQSFANAGGKTPDHILNPLTQLGQAQAQNVAEQLDCQPSLIAVSPFPRAQQTAEPIRQRFPHSPVEEWAIEEFTFLNTTLYHNTSEADRWPHVSAFWNRADPTYIDGPGSESFTQFLDRAREAIRRLIALNPGACVVLVTHGYFMQAFRLIVLFPHATDAELMQNFLQFHLDNFIKNVDLLEFEIRDGKIKSIGQPHLGGVKGVTLQGENFHA